MSDDVKGLKQHAVARSNAQRVIATPTSDGYFTPPWVFQEMGIEFDLDVCAPVGGVPWIPARRHFSLVDDGLASPWEGRVWMNPPFSKCKPWVDKFIEHRNGVCLVQVSKTKHSASLWEEADALTFVGGFVFMEPEGYVRTHHAGVGQVFMPCWFAAFGEESVDAISRIGSIRLKGKAQDCVVKDKGD